MATPAVPTDGDLDEPPATSPAASPGRRSPPTVQGSESDHFARFQRFLQLEREGRLNPAGQRRTREREKKMKKKKELRAEVPQDHRRLGTERHLSRTSTSRPDSG